MKISKTLLLLATVFCAFTIYSCKKDNSSSQTTSTPLSARPAYEKRWDISSMSHRPALPSGSAGRGTFFHPSTNNLAHRPASPDTGYVAIEFLINSYVIFYSDNTIQVGQYSATNDTTLVLDSLGTIYI